MVSSSLSVISSDLSQAMATSANPILAERETRDPTLICTAYKRQRFYLFTRSEPEYYIFFLVIVWRDT